MIPEFTPDKEFTLGFGGHLFYVKLRINRESDTVSALDVSTNDFLFMNNLQLKNVNISQVKETASILLSGVCQKVAEIGGNFFRRWLIFDKFIVL
jgi:hypothetical protein